MSSFTPAENLKPRYYLPTFRKSFKKNIHKNLGDIINVDRREISSSPRLTIFLRPYHFLKLVSFLGANRNKSAPVCLWLLRGAI